MKIIVYGVYSKYLRRHVERFLSDEYEIIGYSDTYEVCDGLDGKRFIPIDEIVDSGCDYVVIAIDSEAGIKSVRQALISRGITEEKILAVKDFFLPENINRYMDMVGCVEAKSGEYDNAILGLSYSYRGIIEERMNQKTINFSMLSTDFYYNRLLFIDSIERGVISGIRNVYFFMPYYYFDHDLSKSVRPIIRGRMMAYYRLGDFHNAAENPLTVGYIAMIRMFAEKTMEFYGGKNIPIQRNCPTFNSRYDDVGLKRFGQHFERTVLENKEYFRQLLSYLKSKDMRLSVIIPPFYLKKVSDDYKKKI